MKKSKTSPKRSDFGKTFTKSPNKRKSLNPFDSSSSSSSEYHEVGPGEVGPVDDDKSEEMKRDSLERAFQVIEKAEEVNCASLERALQVIEKGEEINCDSLERAFKDLEKSIECMEASSQVPKVALDSSEGSEKRTTNLSVVEEYSPGSPANSSFEGSLRLSPRMARATILRPRSASPRTRSFSFGRDESECADQEYNNLWEKRSSSPGIIEYLSDRSKDQSLSKLHTVEGDNEIRNEKETTAEPHSVEHSPQNTSQPQTPLPESEDLTPCKAKNASVSSTIGDEFFFDERDFYEISDMESDTSLDEFELRSKGSELELSDLESERYWSTQKSKNPPKPVDQITEEDNSKTLTRDEADPES
ncbi:uncharacterized protein LOC134821575 [Bolinopsis microptera]|uniref:uncharacterized protein LOC134821575 n=1 Tax=Bolinopsis microptera TaxID=2820187 RepID=UPI00307A8E00